MTDEHTIDLHIFLTSHPEKWTGPREQIFQWPLGLRVPNIGERMMLSCPDGKAGHLEMLVTVDSARPEIYFGEDATIVTVVLRVVPDEVVPRPRVNASQVGQRPRRKK